ncbi:MAG: PilC/PilY family type IV pilus protein [Burkholderiaceae bacterium]
MQRRLPYPFMLAFAACGFVPSTDAGATDVARVAFQTGNQAKPNVIFGMDNSGSMSDEVLLSGTNDGAFWWNTNSRVMSGWANGVPLFGGGMTKYDYLFPNGCTPTDGHRQYCDASGHYAIAPTLQLASLRSSSYNPIYYDPMKTYVAWAPATISNTLLSFGPANPSAALTDPLYAVTMPLNANAYSTSSDYTFHMVAGMVVPAGSSRYDTGTGAWVPVPADFTVADGSAYDVAISYYPATYWVKQACAVNAVDCTTAPDGATLRRYQIKPGATFPSGRSYADEMQNFANWFTYARKRRLMLASSMGQVMNSLTGMRVGVEKFNGSSTVTMYDTDSTDPNANGRVVAGVFYNNSGGGGTPTRDNLMVIGEQFRTNRSVIQSSCQRNAAIIVTDGFASPSATTPPAYAAATYGGGPPYQTTWPNTLADIALSYYTNNLRPDLATGNVKAADPNDPNPAADKNPNLHMNTYAITLGPIGDIWPARVDPYAAPAIAWPNPTANTSPTSIDDLWHATINGRGTMLMATNPSETATAVQSALGNILLAAGAQSALSFSSPILSASNSIAYAGIYRPVNFTGDVRALAVDPATGVVNSAPLWSADANLLAAPWTGRRIFSYDGSAGTAFTAAYVGARVNPGGIYGSSDALVAYLRGDRSNEGVLYRPRTSLLGGVLNAEPVVDTAQNLVYGTTNEGMVHAFDSATGRELWAYVPGFTHAGIGAQSRPSWAFQTLLDATPTLASADARRILVGGAGSAGAGYYALDVTQPASSLTEAQLAGRVLWEFPNSTSVSSRSSNAQVRAEVGTSMGKPVVVKSASRGWVVLVTSGYNSAGDGKGRLFLLNAATGAILSELVTTAGAPGNGDAGLAQVSAFVESDGTSRYVYGGDLLGNLWRFDIEAGSVSKLATLTNAGGAALPIAAAPELGSESQRRMVFIGTGKMLGASDLADTGTNTMFAIWDNGVALTNPRQQLAARTIAGGSVTGPAIDWSTQRGWYVDLPAGEKANTDPSLAYGILGWTTNHPSGATCSASSTLYVAAAATGLQLPAANFAGAPFYGVALSATLASRGTYVRLSSGALVVATQQSDASTTSHKLLVSTGVTPHKNVWREIRR